MTVMLAWWEQTSSVSDFKMQDSSLLRFEDYNKIALLLIITFC